MRWRPGFPTRFERNSRSRCVPSSRALRRRWLALPDLTQRYGPFTGARFLIARHLARRDQMVGDLTTFSHDFLVDPLEGRIYRRGGSSGVGSATGVLETVVANAAPFARQILAFDSPSLTDKYPTHLVLFLDEASGFGWLYWRSTNSGVDLNFAEKMLSLHYTHNLAVGNHAIYVPVAYEANATDRKSVV